MFYIYLLQDLKGKNYIGYSSNLRRRIKEHFTNQVYTSKRMDNPKLIYYESYISEDLAKNREKKLKQFGSAYHGLIKRLNLVKSNI